MTEPKDDSDFGAESAPPIRPLTRGSGTPSGKAKEADWGGFTHRSRFAIRVLIGVAVTFAFSALCYIGLVWGNFSKQAQVFADVMKTVLPAIATLVLGYIVNDRQRDAS